MVGLALVVVGDAAVVVGLGIFRVDLDRLVEIVNRPVVLAFIPIGPAAVVVGNGKIYRRLITGLYQAGAGANRCVERKDILTLRLVR